MIALLGDDRRCWRRGLLEEEGLWGCACEYRHPWKSAKGLRFPGAGVTGSSELADVGAPFLYKNSMHS